MVPLPDSVPPRMSTYRASRVPFWNFILPFVSMFAPEKDVSLAPLVMRTFIVAAPVPDTFSSQTVESDEITASCAPPETLRALAIQRTSGVPAAVQFDVVLQLLLAEAFDQL